MPKLLRAERVQLHRGPDSQSVHQVGVNGWSVYLGHQRLSIIDLTKSGNQPMSSDDGNFWITYNGEVYNFVEIREDLKKNGWQFRSHSDTEVILAAIQHWGVEEALLKFNGMWAFALLDIRNRRLVLARDRVGIKPLYIHICDNDIYFSSEIKAIAEMSSKKFSLNHETVGQFLMQSLLDVTDDTFFDGVNKIPSAHYCVVELSKDRLQLDFHRYWKMSEKEHEVLLEDALIEEIRDIFCDAVRLRLRSDVPVGVLVSGGIDSSAIAVAMQNILGKNTELNLLGMVSDDPSSDEGPYIDILSKHMGIDVHKVNLKIEPEQAIRCLETVCWYNDEPVGSFSSIAHHMLMKKAHELGVTVIMSGQGGDELLCGYKKYLGFYLYSLLQQGRYFTMARTVIDFLNRGTIINQFTMREAKRYLPRYLEHLDMDISGPAIDGYVRTKTGIFTGGTVREKQIKDFERFSIPVLVHSEDRMSMSCSREIRLPFLDYRLVERIIALPNDLKLRDGWTKYIFRKSMETMLPYEIVWRKKKQGFDVPQSKWLKNDLQNTVMSIISDEESLMFKNGLVDRKRLMNKYDRFQKQGSRLGMISSKDIFNPLSLEIWLRAYSCYI